MSQIKLALIGCGGLARVHTESGAKIPEAEFIAYVDVVEANAQNFLADFGGDYATTDSDQIFADDRIDAVYICTRHDSHAPLAIAAARAGKPFGRSLPTALASSCTQFTPEMRPTSPRT